ncbi:hypothetical protein Tco_0378518 [Tanacetum coccineum]
MSDSEDSTVTYTTVSSPFEGLSDIGSPGFDGPPVMPEDPYAYMPLPAAVSPSADSPGYIPESDPEEDPEDDPEEDHEEDPADYPADGGDDDDDDESSYDDKDDDDEEDDNEDEEGEEEHPALADSVLPPIHHVTTRIFILAQAPTPFWSEAEIPSPPLPVSSLSPVSPPPPASPIHPLGYRAVMIRLRSEAPSNAHPPPLGIPPSGIPPLLPIPVPTSSPSLLLPSTDHRANVLDVCLPPRKRLCIAFGPRYEVRDSSSALAARPTGGFRADYGFVATMDKESRRDLERDVGYGITDTWDEMLEDMPRAPVSDETELGRRMTNFITTIRQNTDEVYSRLADAQDARAREARLSREAWSRSMEASDTACAEAQVITLQSQRGPVSGPAQPDVSEEAGSSS